MQGDSKRNAHMGGKLKLHNILKRKSAISAAYLWLYYKKVKNLVFAVDSVNDYGAATQLTICSDEKV